MAGEIIPIALVILVVGGLIGVKVSLKDKVSHTICHERRKEINSELRIALDKFDKFKDEQSIEHKEINRNLTTMMVRQEDMIKKLDTMKWGNG